MKIQFTQQIEIQPTIVGHSTVAVEVSGVLENPEKVFCNIWEDVGDDELKRWLYADGFHMVKRDSEDGNKITINAEMLEALKEAEAALSHEYWMTGESAAVIRAAIDKSPHIIKIRAAIKKATE